MQVDIFGNIIIEEEVIETKISKPSPFSFTNNVANKQYPQSLEGYSPWLFNVSYSQRPETVYHANEMNKYSSLSEKAQFDFYYYSLPKKNFFAKWAKADKVENIEAVCSYYGCSEKEAIQYLKVLTFEQLSKVVEWANNSKGGKNDSRSSNVPSNGNVSRSKR